MLVILLVARIAIRWCADIHTILMTGLTNHISVFSFQNEVRKAVVEFRRSPAFHGMTGFTIPAVTSLVRLVVEVAGMAGSGGVDKIAPSARVRVALRTRKPLMSAAQVE